MENTMITDFINLLILFLPAMVANATPVVFKGKIPIDGGFTFLDGRRILGDGKTIEGFIAGVIAGTLLGIVEGVVLNRFELVTIGFIGGIGAMSGDLLGSFIKRRLGFERGQSLIFIDQLDFALLTGLLYYVYGIEIKVYPFVLLLFVIFILHIGTNRIAYKLGLKPVPY